MIKSIISLFSVISSSTMVLAYDAPQLTDKQILDNAFINLGDPIEINYKGQIIEADFIEEESVIGYAHANGNKLFVEDYLNPISNGRRLATNQQVLNQNGKLIQVTAENSGPHKFFEKLLPEHHDKWACKYKYTVPHIPGRRIITPFQDEHGETWAYWEDLKMIPRKDINVYLIFNPDDLGPLPQPVIEPILIPTAPILTYTPPIFTPPLVPIPSLVPTLAPTPSLVPTISQPKVHKYKRGQIWYTQIEGQSAVRHGRTEPQI